MTLNLPNTRWLDFRNDSGETLPASGLARITGLVTVSGRVFYTVDQPDGSSDPHAVNGRVDIADGEYGKMAFGIDGAVWVKYNTGQTPTFVEEWGPINASWDLDSTGNGFTIYGNAASGIVLAKQDLSVICAAQNEIQIITIFGSPTGGTFDVDLTINSVTEAVTIDYNDAASAVKTALEGHSEMASGDATCTGGPLPDAAVKVEFTGDQATTDVPIMLPDWSSLTGGTGVGVIISVDQQGR